MVIKIFSGLPQIRNMRLARQPHRPNNPVLPYIKESLESSAGSGQAVYWFGRIVVDRLPDQQLGLRCQSFLLFRQSDALYYIMYTATAKLGERDPLESAPGGVPRGPRGSVDKCWSAAQVSRPSLHSMGPVHVTSSGWSQYSLIFINSHTWGRIFHGSVRLVSLLFSFASARS